MTFGFSLVDVNGTSRALDGSLGIYVRRGMRGGGYPDIKPSGDKLPYAPGVALRRVETAAGIVEVPLRAERSTQALLETLLDDLRGWVLPGTERNNTPSTVKLQVTGAGGAVREIEGVATLDRGDDGAGWTKWQLYILTLFCADPYWRDASASTFTFTSGTGVRTWWPLYDLDLTPSAVYAEQTITLGGHVEAWPIWTITGPGSDPTLTNLTTGEVLALEGLTLLAGDVVTVDTSERGETAKTITNQNDANLWPYASPTSQLWPLGVGANDVRVQLANTSGASSVALDYRRRWAGGHR